MKVLIFGSGNVGTALLEIMKLQKIEVNIIALRGTFFSSFQIQRFISHATHVVWAGKDISTISEPGEDNVVFFNDLLNYLATKKREIHFTYISSGGAIYGNADFFPTAETQEINPISLYGHGKKMGEERLGEISKHNSNLGLLILRVANLYSLDLNNRNFISSALKALQSDSKLIIYGGNQSRDFLHISDFANISFSLLSHSTTGIFNIGTGRSYSLFQVLEILGVESKKTIKIETYPLRGEDVIRSELDIRKMHNEYGEELIDLSMMLVNLHSFDI